MIRTKHVSVSITLLAALLAASLLALGLARTASSQEGKKPQGDASAERVGVQQTSEQVITSDGPLTSIAIGDDLSCQVDHEGDGEGGEFFFGDPSALETSCGTLLAVGDTTFGQFFNEEFTPVSQSAVTGTGTRFNPFKITTVVDAGETGLRLTQTDSYVIGNDFYSTQVRVRNQGSSSQNAILYKFGDCYLYGSDGDTRGKVVQTGFFGDAPACESTDEAEPGEIRLLPRSRGSTYQAGELNVTFEQPFTQEPYENTCDDCPNEIDSGLGLSWEISVPAGRSVSRSLQTQVIIPESSP